MWCGGFGPKGRPGTAEDYDQNKLDDEIFREDLQTSQRRWLKATFWKSTFLGVLRFMRLHTSKLSASLPLLCQILLENKDCPNQGPWMDSLGLLAYSVLCHL